MNKEVCSVKEVYETPEMEIVELEKEDIMTSNSGEMNTLPPMDIPQQ